MAWTIWVEKDQIGPAYHLYIEIFDDNGNRVAQYNGLATDPVPLTSIRRRSTMVHHSVFNQGA